MDRLTKVVILTNKGSQIGKKIIQAFLLNRIDIAAVLVVEQPFTYYWKLFQSVRKRIGLLDAIYFSIARTLFFNIRKRPLQKRGDFIERYEKMGIPVIYTKGTNSKGTLRCLKNLSPDLLVLGQTGIVGREILEIPIQGTLNAHPGILPYYRGIDCAKWAIFNQEFDKVGATVHWVDSGVDTGNILLREYYTFSGDDIIDSLSENLYDLCITALVKVVLLMGKGEIPVGGVQGIGEGRQYHKMPRRTEKITEARLKEFLERGNGKFRYDHLRKGNSSL